MNIFVICLIAVIAFSSAGIAYADTEKGINFDRVYLGTTPDGTKAVYQWSSHAERILDYYSDGNPVYADYRLFQDTNIVQVETANSGSLVFDKNTCSYNLYNSGRIDRYNSVQVANISWTVKGKAASSSNWASVNSVNGASCQVSVAPTETSVKITGTKTSTVGTFQIVLSYTPGNGIKETMRAYNNNPAWTNHNIGFTEKLQVPQYVTLGNQTFNLANYNGTVLDKNWIASHRSQTMHLASKIFYDFGLGYSSLNDIKITWDGKKAFISVNYLFSDGIVPYQSWFEVDPTFTGTSSYSGYSGASTGAIGASCPVTTSYTNNTGSNKNINPYRGKSADVDNCQRGLVMWNIGTIPDLAKVIDTDFKFEIFAATSAVNCSYYPMQFKPNIQSAYTMYQDAGNGTAFLANDATCTTTGTNKSVDLGTVGDAYVQSQLTSDWAALGVRFTDETRDTTAPNVVFLFAGTPAPTLQVTYEYGTPSPPRNLACTGLPFKISCLWDTPTTMNGTNGYTISRSLNNSTWTNKTATGNVTSYTITQLNINKSYYVRVNATTPAFNSTSSNVVFVTTDNYPSVPLNPTTTPMSNTVIKLNWQNGSSTGGDTVIGFRIDYCITCSAWSNLVNVTSTLNYNHTGLSAGQTVKYRIAAWNGVGLSPYTANFTGRTFTPTTGTVTSATGVIGDTVQVNSTVSITDASPSPVTVSQLKLYRNGTLIETKAVSVSIASGASSSNFDPFWNRMTTDDVYSYKIRATVSNSTGTVTLSSANFTETREYDPSYRNADDNPTVEGLVNYTLARFDDEDGVHLQVNRQGGTLGGTWTINCIVQTNAEAQATRNQSLTWPGTWINYSNVGYFNGTWDGMRNTQGYVTCFNPPGQLFTTTSFTNSSLALFGIQVFDDSYGAMLGVPVGIFFLALAGGMANKRTAPTWIVVLLGMAGIMATIGFFTVSPIVWGLALVTGLLGLLVNQKVF